MCVYSSQWKEEPLFLQQLTGLVLEQKLNPTAKMSKLKKDENITTNLETKKNYY